MRKLIALALGSLLFLTSCAQVINSVFDATLAIHVTSFARTLEATQTEALATVDHYSATLTSTSGGGVVQIDDLNQAKTIALTTGPWSVVVKAYARPGNADSDQIGEGRPENDPITVVSRENSINVKLGPVRKGYGSFDLTVDYSEEATGVDFSLMPWPNTDESAVFGVVTATTTSAGTIPPKTGFLQNASYTLNLRDTLAEFKGTLRSGDYLVQITTHTSSTSSGNSTTYSEILRVYDNIPVKRTLTHPSHNVKFNPGLGTGTVVTQPIPFGMSSALVSFGTLGFGAPNASGKVFDGWKQSTSITLIADEASYFMQSTEDVTLTAQWRDPVVILYNYDGTLELARPVVTNRITAALTNSGGSPPSSSMVFDGWYLGVSGAGVRYGTGSTYTIPMTVTSDVKLYANWLALVTLHFDGNGANGGSMTDRLLTPGQTITLASNGFTNSTASIFGGWTIIKGGTVAYANGASFTIGNSAVTLYAKWSSVPVYALNVSSSNTTYGTVSVQEGAGPFTAGTLIHLTATPLANYAFVNWEGDISGVAGARSAVTTLTMPSEAVTITANFSVPSTGALSSTDRRSYGRGANFYADIYSFTISTAQTVTISMVAPGKDSFLYLYKNSWQGGDFIALNDDSGGTLDSMIGPISLAPGTYFVDATSYGQLATFSYTLTASSTSGAIALTQY